MWTLFTVEYLKGEIMTIPGISTLGDIGVPQTNLVLVPPPPCVEADWMKFIEERDGVKMKEPGKTLALTEKYHQACIEVANKSGHRCHHFIQFFLVATL